MDDVQRPFGIGPPGREGHAPAQTFDDGSGLYGMSNGSEAPFGSPLGQYSLSSAPSISEAPRTISSTGAQSLESGAATVGAGSHTFNMGAMGAALPGVGQPLHGLAPSPGVQRYTVGPFSHPSQFQQQPLQHAGLSGFSNPQQEPQVLQYLQSHSPGPQGAFASPPFLSQTGSGQRSGPATPTHQGFPSAVFPGQQLPSQPMMYYSPGFGSMGANSQGYQGVQRLQTGPGGFGAGFPPGARHGAQGLPGPITVPPLRLGLSTGRVNTAASPSAIPSAPRGPPRKPKQSGHALWVGNLPPGAVVNELKDHFSRDATKDIESVFLISKSNCAFVNYRTEHACADAMTRFHDSRFHGVRLVCRLRRSPSPGAPGAPTGPSALSASAPSPQTAIEAIDRNREVSARVEESLKNVEGAAKIEDKYFIVKSLTVEDLELSVRNGIWATQPHNEGALNRAYDSVKNVYLIFSANKSGEYFGYARMASPINEESAADLEWTPASSTAVSVAADPELPRSIPTPATATAPRGHIIDDSARGTIFWEAEHDDDGDNEDLLAPSASTTAQQRSTSPIAADPSLTPQQPPSYPVEVDGVQDGVKTPTSAATSPQPFGTPFRVEWVSTHHLPFHRTRGLRNPWNANREVKIARDGTELETAVGRRLVALFTRGAPVSPAAGPGPSPGPQGYRGHSPGGGGGYGMQGYPQLHRPF